jgi:hypothetical protein
MRLPLLAVFLAVFLALSVAARPLGPNRAPRRAGRGFMNQSTFGEPAQRGSRVSHRPIQYLKNLTSSPSPGVTIQVEYNATIRPDLVSLDTHLDVVQVICTNDTLEIVAADPSIFIDWRVGAIVVGSPFWNCSVGNGTFYRNITGINASANDAGVVLLNTTDLEYMDCFSALDISYFQVPMDEEETRTKRPKKGRKNNETLEDIYENHLRQHQPELFTPHQMRGNGSAPPPRNYNSSIRNRRLPVAGDIDTSPSVSMYLNYDPGTNTAISPLTIADFSAAIEGTKDHSSLTANAKIKVVCTSCYSYLTVGVRFRLKFDAGVNVWTTWGCCTWLGCPCPTVHAQAYFNLYTFGLEFFGTFGVESIINIDAAGSLNYEYQKRILSKKITDLFFWVGPVPVKIGITAGLDARTSVMGSFTGQGGLGLSYNKFIRLGFSYENGQLTTIRPESVTNYRNTPFWFTQKGSQLTAKFYLIPWIEPSLYGILNTRFLLMPYVGATLSTGVVSSCNKTCENYRPPRIDSFYGVDIGFEIDEIKLTLNLEILGTYSKTFAIPGLPHSSTGSLFGPSIIPNASFCVNDYDPASFTYRNGSCLPETYEFIPCTGLASRRCTNCTKTCGKDMYETTRCSQTSNRGCTACTTCSAGQYESQPCGISNRVCATCISCSSGKFERAPCTLTSNRVCLTCSPCAAGSFESVPCTIGADRRCTPCSPCAHGTFETVPCTATSNRICSPCSAPCSPGFFASRPCSALADRICQRCLECVANISFESAACSPTSNRQCSTCSAPCQAGVFERQSCTISSDRSCSSCSGRCASGYYEFSPCTATSNRQCRICSTCATGFYMISECTNSTDRVCDACRNTCDSGFYETEPCTSTNNRQCSPCLRCVQGKFLAMACTMYSDSVCENCATCLAGTYETSGCRSTSNTRCAACSAPCRSGSYEVSPCSSTADRECRSCTDRCPAESFQSAPCESFSDHTCTPCAARCLADSFEVVPCDTISNRQCRVCSVCSPGTFETQPCSESSDRVCSSCTMCGAGEYELAACSSTSNRVCSRCSSTCNSTSYEAEGCFGRQNRVCRSCSDCRSEFYEVQACNEASDRVCAACSVNCLSETFESQPCTISSNRECTACMKCENNAFEVAPCTARSPRACDFCTNCTAEQFEITNCTHATNRVCQQCTECGIDEYQIADCTENTDRRCTAIRPPCGVSEYEIEAAAWDRDRECLAVDNTTIVLRRSFFTTAGTKEATENFTRVTYLAVAGIFGENMSHAVVAVIFSPSARLSSHGMSVVLLVNKSDIAQLQELKARARALYLALESTEEIKKLEVEAATATQGDSKGYFTHYMAGGIGGGVLFLAIIIVVVGLRRRRPGRKVAYVKNTNTVGMAPGVGIAGTAGIGSVLLLNGASQKFSPACTQITKRMLLKLPAGTYEHMNADYGDAAFVMSAKPEYATIPGNNHTVDSVPPMEDADGPHDDLYAGFVSYEQQSPVPMYDAEGPHYDVCA